MHDVAPRDVLDRVAFFVAFVAGAFGSIAIKALGTHPFFAAGYAAMVLIAYALLAWAGGRVKLEPETIGDNCYYLGFLFTLSSLSYTLYQMSDPTTNAGRPVDIPVVISGFGVALSSTIVGVFLRVLMMQLRTDFVAKDREVRADINRSFSDFRKNMAGMLSQMKAYSAESVQLASERDERIRKSTENFVDDYRQALKKSTTSLADHMKEAFSEAMRDVVKEFSEAQKASHEQMESTLKELEALKNRLNEQEAQSFEQIGARRKVLLKEIAEYEKAIKTQSEVTEAHIKATRRATDAISMRFIPALDGMKERLDTFPPTSPAEVASLESKNVDKKNLEDPADQPVSLKAETPPGPWRGKSGKI
ncbi:putative SpoU family rRNA methylase [Roseovarius sp. MBR-51]